MLICCFHGHSPPSGTFHYLANDPKVPAAIRANYQKYGLCRDEFVDNDFMPVQLYVRISNRLVGDYVMTQNNICRPTVKSDSIAVSPILSSILAGTGRLGSRP